VTDAATAEAISILAPIRFDGEDQKPGIRREDQFILASVI
jgi:hypothetical protein